MTKSCSRDTGNEIQFFQNLSFFKHFHKLTFKLSEGVRSVDGLLAQRPRDSAGLDVPPVEVPGAAEEPEIRLFGGEEAAHGEAAHALDVSAVLFERQRVAHAPAAVLHFQVYAALDAAQLRRISAHAFDLAVGLVDVACNPRWRTGI